MGRQADAMEALDQEAKHLKKLLEKCTELSTLVAGDLASITTSPDGCISCSAILQHWNRMQGGPGRGDLAKLIMDIAALGSEIENAKGMALDASERLAARIRWQNEEV